MTWLPRLPAHLNIPYQNDRVFAMGNAVPDSETRSLKPASDQWEGADGMGERIRRVRLERGLTLRQLARAAVVSPSTIHKLENGQLVPSVEVFVKVARALHRRASYFLGDEDGAVEMRLVRRAGRRLLLTDSRLHIEAVAEALREPRMEAYVVTVPPRARSGSPLGYKGELLFFCCKGAIDFMMGARTERLEPGDAFHLKASIPHRLTNPSATPAEVLVVWAP